MSDNFNDISLAKALAGLGGAFVSLNFVQGTVMQRFFLATGGATMSYFFSTQVSFFLGMKEAEGMIGFLIGMFGMAIAAKVYEVIQMLDAKAASDKFLAWLARKWGA